MEHAFLAQLVKREHQRAETACDAGAAGTTIRLNDVTVNGDGALAQPVEVGDRPQSAADQPLDFSRARRQLEPLNIARRAALCGARQHGILRCHPAAALSLHKRRHAVFNRRVADNFCVSTFNEHRTLGISDKSSRDFDRSDFKNLSPVIPSHKSTPFSLRRTL